MAKDAESAKKAQAQIDFGEQALANVEKIKNLMEEFGSVEFLDRGAVSAEQSARTSLQIQLKELFNLGVLNGPDLELLEKFTGADFFSPTTLESTKRQKLLGAEVFIKNRINSSLSRAGLPKLGNKKEDLAIKEFKKRGLSERQAATSVARMKSQGKL